MFSLIIIVISIGLMAAVLAATLNYVPMDAQLRQQMYKEAERGVKALDCAVTRYLDANRGSDGNIIYPGDDVALSSAVTPAYGFMPANVRKDMTWQVVTGQVSGMPAVGICLYPVSGATTLQREVLLKLQAQLPVGGAYVGAACNATANTAEGAALTYWVPLAHVN